MAYKECKEVTLDLLKFGMAQSYTEWTFHGEGEEGVNEPLNNSEGADNEEDQERCDDASAYEMINNVIRGENLGNDTITEDDDVHMQDCEEPNENASNRNANKFSGRSRTPTVKS